MKEATCTAPVNIAVVKYWGKRDENLILPINSSLSVTLDQEHLRAKTSIRLSTDFTSDRIWLNGEEQNINTPRLQNVLREVRLRDPKKQVGCVHIVSENNFPTAAGLASSAAGLACLGFYVPPRLALDHIVYEIGSGSACRSIYGGYVDWQMGIKPDGSDSLAHQIADERHLPDFRVMICVVNINKKHIGSTSGMQTSVKNSALLKYRAECIVPKRMKVMANAILNKDFDTFAEETMKDSNQMHACCLDTYPPISYLTDTSREIIRIVHALNSLSPHHKVAYTFDAGPNACLYMPAASIPEMAGLLMHYFPSADTGSFITGLPLAKVQAPCKELIELIGDRKFPGAIQYLINTQPGPGPQVLSDGESLIAADGQPKQ